VEPPLDRAKFQHAKRSLLYAGKSDIIDMAEVASIMKNECLVCDPHEARRLSVAVLRGLIQDGLIWFGDAVPGIADGRLVIDPWAADAEEIATRIDAEWRNSERPWLGLYEIGWFTLSEHGRDVARLIKRWPGVIVTD